MTPKLFSPAHANAALPLVRRIVSDIVEHQGRLADLVSAYQEAKRAAQPSPAALDDARRALTNVTAQRDACVAELTDLGVQLKDAQTGLIDFPSQLEGEEVLLCWRLGEERVEFFHTETAGFAGRRPIPVPAPVG
jgi:hypothetical protein